MKSLFVFTGGATVGSVATVIFAVRAIVLHEPTMRFLSQAAGEKLANWILDDEPRRPRTPYSSYRPTRHSDRRAEVDAAALDFLQKRHEETSETGWSGADCVDDVTRVLQDTGRL